MHADNIKNLIQTQLPHAQITVDSKDGKHYRAVVISPDFEGKTRLEQHQMVYKALDSALKSGQIHAISIKTATKP